MAVTIFVMGKVPPTVHSFDAIANAESVVLVLGTMPGRESLKAQQYYVHPGNAFWRLIEDVLDIGREAEYSTRIKGLLAAKVALWDVLRCCTRESSLDSDIVEPVVNDFASFFKTHPRIKKVFFNGATAEKHYYRSVARTLPSTINVDYVRLPSTSAALAIKYEAKLASWKVIKTGK